MIINQEDTMFGNKWLSGSGDIMRTHCVLHLFCYLTTDNGCAHMTLLIFCHPSTNYGCAPIIFLIFSVISPLLTAVHTTMFLTFLTGILESLQRLCILFLCPGHIF